MKALTKMLLVALLVMGLTNVALATDPGDDTATCAIDVTVNQIIEWEGTNFAAISLTPAIAAQGDDPNGRVRAQGNEGCGQLLDDHLVESVMEFGPGKRDRGPLVFDGLSDELCHGMILSRVCVLLQVLLRRFTSWALPA